MRRLGSGSVCGLRRERSARIASWRQRENRAKGTGQWTQQLTSGMVQMRAPASTMIEVSSDLAHWQPLMPLASSGSPVTLTNSAGAAFYRLSAP
jgi:hypothetical protein